MTKDKLNKLSSAVTNAFIAEILIQHKAMADEIKSIIKLVDNEGDQEVADVMFMKVNGLRELIADMECDDDK